METRRVRWAWRLGLFFMLGLPQCKSTAGDDDDAGASGQGTTS